MIEQLIIVIGLLIGTAHAADCDPTAQSCHLPEGTPEWSVWWCGHKLEEVTCLEPDRVECKWLDNACVPK